MDRRFVCEECGAKWFIYEDWTDEPDLAECGRCGGSLARFVAGSVGGGYGSRPDEPTGELGENG